MAAINEKTAGDAAAFNPKETYLSENSTTNELMRFDFHGKTVRMVGTPDNPEWVAADVCDILEHSDVSMALRNLDPDEKGTRNVCTLGGGQEMLVITEPGLYKLLFRSHKKVAKEFTRRVTHEILPEIRKTGSFNATPTPVFSAEAVTAIVAQMLPAVVAAIVPTVHALLLPMANAIGEKPGYRTIERHLELLGCTALGVDDLEQVSRGERSSLGRAMVKITKSHKVRVIYTNNAQQQRVAIFKVWVLDRHFMQEFNRIHNGPKKQRELFPFPVPAAGK